jgi:hypothetical protein
MEVEVGHAKVPSQLGTHMPFSTVKQAGLWPRLQVGSPPAALEPSSFDWGADVLLEMSTGSFEGSCDWPVRPEPDVT